jgi:hypothetical protein
MDVKGTPPARGGQVSHWVVGILAALVFATACGDGKSSPPPAPPPAIVWTSDSIGLLGSPVTFSVEVTGSEPFGYQWKKNGVVVIGETSSSYTSPLVSVSDAGAAFSVRVTDKFGAISESSAPQLRVRGFIRTGSMGARRWQHAATLLPSSKVLVTGGSSRSGTTASSELYDSSTGAFTASGDMGVPRIRHSSTLLKSGTVLVAGGTSSGTVTSTAEVYDPATGKFAPTGNMVTGRYGHTATVLQSGMVLITGGQNDSGSPASALPSAELYDPATGAFAPTGSLTVGRAWHSAAALKNGTVLVTGGSTATGTSGADPLASAELYNPLTGTFAATSNMEAQRWGHTATPLPDGKVLIVGGGSEKRAELYDAAAGAFSFAGSVSELRVGHTATLLPGGNVLIAGPTLGNALTAELYVPDRASFQPGGRFAMLSGQTGTLLPDGTVLVSGGWTGPGMTDDATSGALIWLELP